MIELRSGSSTLLIDEQRGGRLASLVVRRQERLVTPSGADPHPLLWGSYPMVPYVGRVRDGRFRHDGIEHQLPLRLPPHASHGTVLDVAWNVESASRSTARLTCSLGPSWPWPGRVTQEISLHADGRKAGAVRCWISAEALDGAFPAQVGWHPWFADGAVPPLLTFSPTVMYERDESGISTGNTVLPKPRPWDDCFAGVEDSPVLRYRDGVEFVLSSDCDHWVVYEPGQAICVEPMSGPPNGLSLLPHLVAPGRPLSRTFVIAWA